MRVSSRRLLTNEQARSIREQYVAGRTRNSLAIEFGISKRSTDAILYHMTYVDAGGPHALDRPVVVPGKKPVRGKGVDLSAEWVKRATAARVNGGCTWDQVARIVGKSQHQVRYAVNETYRRIHLEKARARARKNYSAVKEARQNDSVEA